MTLFYCSIPFNINISHILKFFKNLDNIIIACGKHGISFIASIDYEECYCVVTIHSHDIYQLYFNTKLKPEGCILKQIDFKQLYNILDNKYNDSNLIFKIDDLCTTLKVKIKNSEGGVRSQLKINLTTPSMIYGIVEYDYANIVTNIKEFKPLSIDLAKSSVNIICEYQPKSVRFIGNDVNITYGLWNPSLPYQKSLLKPTIFKQINKIGIGNAHQIMMGIYVKNTSEPLIVKIRLGIIDFVIYTKQNIFNI